MANGMGDLRRMRGCCVKVKGLEVVPSLVFMRRM